MYKLEWKVSVHLDILVPMLYLKYASMCLEYLQK